jgi:alpha-L-rhamnosidase
LTPPKYDWGWNSTGLAGGTWVTAASAMRDAIFAGVNKAHSADAVGDNPWGLVPDELPPMEYDATSGRRSGPRGYCPSCGPSLPRRSLSLPMRMCTFCSTARRSPPPIPNSPSLVARARKIILTYSEALYDKDCTRAIATSGRPQGSGPDGQLFARRRRASDFEPLWWRTWRYLDLDITTGDEPLTLDSLKAEFTAYPFQERAAFKTAMIRICQDMGDQLADGAAGCA